MRIGYHNRLTFLVLLILFSVSVTGSDDWFGRNKSLSITEPAEAGESLPLVMGRLNMSYWSEREKAPDFKLASIGKGNVSLSGYNGKVVLLSFWATW